LARVLPRSEGGRVVTGTGNTASNRSNSANIARAKDIYAYLIRAAGTSADTARARTREARKGHLPLP
jgi:hypothetical protein